MKNLLSRPVFKLHFRELSYFPSQQPRGILSPLEIYLLCNTRASLCFATFPLAIEQNHTELEKKQIRNEYDSEYSDPEVVK